MCLYIYMYVYIYISIFIYVYIYVYIYIYTYIYTYTHIYRHTCTYVYILMYTYLSGDLMLIMDLRCNMASIKVGISILVSANLNVISTHETIEPRSSPQSFNVEDG